MRPEDHALVRSGRRWGGMGLVCGVVVGMSTAASQSSRGLIDEISKSNNITYVQLVDVRLEQPRAPSLLLHRTRPRAPAGRVQGDRQRRRGQGVLLPLGGGGGACFRSVGNGFQRVLTYFKQTPPFGRLLLSV